MIGRTAVVGAGIFGVCAALALTKAGHNVTLFEQRENILLGATRTNQRRLHRGYHYPRSAETAIAARDSFDDFVSLFGSAIVYRHPHLVGIASEGSKTDADSYLKFCNALNLHYREATHTPFRRGSMQLEVSVEEYSLDIEALRHSALRMLHRAGIALRCGHPPSASTLGGFDFAVFATYATPSWVASHSKPDSATPRYQFELCEKPLFRVPRQLGSASLLVLDGAFMSIDPFDETSALMGHVTHGIHATTVGTAPETPPSYAGLIDQGLVAAGDHSHAEKFKSAAHELFSGSEEIDHLGSFYTWKVVPAHSDATDARPSVTQQLDERSFAILGGKISTAPTVARRLVEAINEAT